MTNDNCVLVVEDEPLLRLDISESLMDAGFIVFEACNASEAIDILSKHLEIRLVFTDVDMPGGMDGIVLAAYIRDRWPPLKIIVTSGFRSVSNADIPAESRFFRKPYDPGTIASTMREMLDA